MNRLIKSALLAAMAGLLLAGCSGLHDVKPIVRDHDQRNPNDKLGHAPGLFVKEGDHYDNGLVLFSTDGASKFGKQPNKKGKQPAESAGNYQYYASPADKASFEAFKQFQAFKKFESLPEAADQRQHFQQWKEWQHYQQWKQANGKNQPTDSSPN